MKAFRFRPERVLDWREMERTVAASRVEAAQTTLARLSAELSTINAALARGPEPAPTGASLANQAAWRNTLLRHRTTAEQRVSGAQIALQQQHSGLLEASRRVKLLEKLNETSLSRWHRDLDRETAAFAAEVHLSRYNRTGGARSSSG